jgi:hypothetical protein
MGEETRGAGISPWCFFYHLSAGVPPTHTPVRGGGGVSTGNRHSSNNHGSADSTSRYLRRRLVPNPHTGECVTFCLPESLSPHIALPWGSAGCSFPPLQCIRTQSFSFGWKFFCRNFNVVSRPASWGGGGVGGSRTHAHQPARQSPQKYVSPLAPRTVTADGTWKSRKNS